MPRDTMASAHPGDAPALSVVVPCFNEEEGLAELHRRVTAVCRETVGDDYEVVLIDDGSRDRTWSLIEDLAARDPRVVGVSLSRNHGHQLALSAGLAVCAGRRILVLDADLQDPPELLPEMMRRMDDGADIVYGQRAERLGETWFKKTSAALFYRLLNRLSDVAIPRDTGDFRLMSRRVLDVLNRMPEQQRFIRGMVGWIGYRQVPIAYERQERFAGTTKYPLAKMLRLAVDAITGFSIRPLKLATLFAMSFGVLALLGIFHVLGSWWVGHTVPGWTSVILVVLIMGSVHLFMLGIIGEYLGRAYIESKRRPLFLIDRVIGAGERRVPTGVAHAEIPPPPARN